MDTRKDFAAVLIDFENFYYSLTNVYEFPYEDAGEAAVTLIANQLEKLKKRYGEIIIRQAFADWSSMQDSKRELQRLGIRIVDILSTQYKNSADIELSLAAQEIILTREDIATIVIFAGDRDYMPIANRIREKGKNLHFVGFEKSLSGDLKKLVGEGNYSYARTDDIQPVTKTGNSGENAMLGVDERVIDGLDQVQTRAAIAALDSYDKYRERFGCVKVSVFLMESLAMELPELDHLGRKKIFTTLVQLGLVVTEKRTPMLPDDYGNQYQYTVFTIDETNKFVKELRKSFSNKESEGKNLLTLAAKKSADSDGKVLGSKLGLQLRDLDHKFLPEKYGFDDLRAFVEHYPEILVYQGERSGGDRVYKLVKV
ncbi:MAG: hypothetical protein B2I17_06725 [Thermoplasmatales archaeon B_DKE]|nr:MAG: hypothetical protein B2I17_06725 [Thermoplasmatales archaeon B_DKE]